MEPKISELSRAKWAPVSLIIFSIIISIISMVTSTIDSTQHHHLNSTHHHLNGDAAFSKSNFFQGRRPRFVIKLIHRDSVESPLYNETSSSASYDDDRVIRDINHSKARAINLLHHPNSLARTSIQHDTPGLYFITFYIHNISYPQYTILDTGSDLIWVMCSSCYNCPHAPLFHILDSSILTPLICSDNKICRYSQRYAQGVGSSGFLASETLLFTNDAVRDDDDEEERLEIKEVDLGCGTELFDTEKHNGEMVLMGIFGIGPFGSFTQKVEYFSYCLESRYVNRGDISSYLAIGDATILKGPSTPLLYYIGHYTALMDGITVGESYIDFFSEKVIIDCGSTHTFLRPRIFDKFTSAVDSIARDILPKYWGELPLNVSLCYKGNLYTMLEEFPEVKFHFASDVQITAGPEQLFMSVGRNLVCLKIFSTTSSHGVESSTNDASLLGTDLQTDYNIGFDVKNKLMYIYNDDPCSELFDS